MTQNSEVAEAALGTVWHAQGAFEIYNIVDTDDEGGSLEGHEPNQIQKLSGSQT